MLAEAKFLNPGPGEFQATGVVVKVSTVPRDVAVAPVRTVNPVGRPVPMPSKSWK